LVFVPHSAAAYTLRQALKTQGLGLLPEIVNIEAPEALAIRLGLDIPAPATPWLVRAKAVEWLQTANPELDVALLIPRCEALLQSLNLLATYGITPAALKAAVPPELREIWALHGSILHALWAWAAPQAAVLLPAGRRAKLWHNIIEALVSHPLLGPKLWWGPVPHEAPLVALHQSLTAQGLQTLNIAVVPSPIVTFEAAHLTQEMQQAALWVAEKLEAGQQPIAVVAGGNFAARLATELLMRFGIVAQTTGGQRWAATSSGEALLAAARLWLGRTKPLSMAYWLASLNGPEPATWPVAFTEVLAPLEALPNRWDGDAAYAWLMLALQALAPRTDDEQVADRRVQIVPPHRAVGQNFAAVWVAELVEGVWPAQGQTGQLGAAQRRALGLPDATQQAEQAHAVLQALVQQGAGQVVFSRSVHDDMGTPLAPSRWWPHTEPYAPRYLPNQWLQPPPPATLGAWQPPVAPVTLSASLMQAILACPYQAYAARVLHLEPLPPLVPEPDPRAAGTLVHAWLEATVKTYPHIHAENATAVAAFMRAEGQKLLAQQTPLVQALWAPKLQRLIPVLIQQWQAAATALKAEVKLRTTLPSGLVVQAKADALGADGTIIDYKTGMAPAKKDLEEGHAPQLPLEAWLVQQAGQTPKQLAYWQLRGYGQLPLKVTPFVAEHFIGTVAPSLTRMDERYFRAKAHWPAVPDAAGLGVLATGACTHCALHGLCRREAVA
jgi:RecB family exonuclease